MNLGMYRKNYTCVCTSTESYFLYYRKLFSKSKNIHTLLYCNTRGGQGNQIRWTGGTGWLGEDKMEILSPKATEFNALAITVPVFGPLPPPEKWTRKAI